MDKARNYLVMFGIGMIAIPGILFLARIARLRCRIGMGENTEKNMYKKMRESKTALEKATSLIKSALEGIQNGNP